MLFEAAHANDVALLKELLAKPLSANTVEPEKSTPIFAAAYAPLMTLLFPFTRNLLFSLGIPCRLFTAALCVRVDIKNCVLSQRCLTLGATRQGCRQSGGCTGAPC